MIRLKNILEMLERTAERFPGKPLFRDTEKAYSRGEFLNTARSIGGFIAEKGIYKKPVALIFERSADNLAAMFGVLYSGNFYTVIDCEMPPERINKIFDTLSPAAVIYSDACGELVGKLNFKGRAFTFAEACEGAADIPLLSRIRESAVETDPAYVLFTSGSTGNPKGVVVSHRSVIAYTGWFTKAFDINENTVFGSQTPFYFSMSVSDVFGTVSSGAELAVIPKTLFSFPMKLLEFLNENRVNTIYWVPSALSIIANWRVLDYGRAEYLSKVLFAGEVMPAKQLNYWRGKLPDAMFANLFGPTETTDICTYYIVDREFRDDESLPIGKHCDNCGVFVVNEAGKEAAAGEEGELYVRGPFLASGYYNDPEKTYAAFVQNPLNSSYPETVYKTGDLVKYNRNGELIYISRIDSQIKHMGCRIELGEIEAAAGAAEGVRSCAAVYDAARDRIIFVYEGKSDAAELVKLLEKRLPAYMLPEEYVCVKSMPYNQNGKIDRRLLVKNYKNT